MFAYKFSVIDFLNVPYSFEGLNFSGLGFMLHENGYSLPAFSETILSGTVSTLTPMARAAIYQCLIISVEIFSATYSAIP